MKRNDFDRPLTEAELALVVRLPPGPPPSEGAAIAREHRHAVRDNGRMLGAFFVPPDWSGHHVLRKRTGWNE